MTDDATNGSAGRFLRMEEKLDTLISHSSAFQLDAVQRLVRLEVSAVEARAKLETAVQSAMDKIEQSAENARDKVAADASTARDVVTDTASDRTFFWMRVGIGVSLFAALLSFVARFLGWF